MSGPATGRLRRDGPRRRQRPAAWAGTLTLALGWVGTARKKPNGRTGTYLEHWDGTSWTVVDTPNHGKGTGDEVHDIAALGPNNVWAVGVWVGGELPQPFVLHWNGVRWSMPSTPSIPLSSGFDGVSGLPGTKTVWGVGDSV